jgi:hypothetical protein
MERYHHPLFEQARTVIEPVLAKLGFKLAEEHYHQRSFGSSLAIYTRGGGELSLVWDGREEVLELGYDSRELIEKRRQPLGPEMRTAEDIPKLGEAIKARFVDSK